MLSDVQLCAVVAKYAATQYGMNALSLAASNGRADCVRLLLQGGAKKDARCGVRCAIFRFTVHIIAKTHFHILFH